MCGRIYCYQITEGRARAWQVHCKAWNCPNCRPRRIRKLKAQAVSGRPRTFITLTVKPELYESPTAAAVALSKNWRRLRRLIEKKYGGKPAHYLTVCEATKKGWPHLHVLTTRGWVDYKWLSETWSSMTGAWNVWIERVKDDRGAAIYVSKYLGKAPHKFGTMKRYYMTRNYCPKRPRGPDSFDWSGIAVQEQAGQCHKFAFVFIEAGWIIVSRSLHFIEIAREPP